MLNWFRKKQAWKPIEPLIVVDGVSYHEVDPGYIGVHGYRRWEGGHIGGTVFADNGGTLWVNGIAFRTTFEEAARAAMAIQTNTYSAAQDFIQRYMEQNAAVQVHDVP